MEWVEVHDGGVNSTPETKLARWVRRESWARTADRARVLGQQALARADHAQFKLIHTRIDIVAAVAWSLSDDPDTLSR